MNELKQPVEWCKDFRVQIIEPSGWMMDHKSYEDAISRVEFQFRLTHSVARSEQMQPPCV